MWIAFVKKSVIMEFMKVILSDRRIAMRIYDLIAKKRDGGTPHPGRAGGHCQRLCQRGGGRLPDGRLDDGGLPARHEPTKKQPS